MAELENKKYLDLAGLSHYDEKIKEFIVAGDTVTLSSAKSYVDDAIKALTGAEAGEDGALSLVGAYAAASEAKDAADAAQADVDALEELVGAVPADATATTVAGYAAEVAAAEAKEVQDDLDAYKESNDAAVKAAQDAADAAQADVDALEELVGKIPSKVVDGEEVPAADTVIDYIDAVVAAASSDAADAADAALEAAAAAQDDVDALEELVGSIPEDAKAKTVVAYAAEVAAAEAAAVQDNLDDLEERVAANESAIEVINGEGEGSIKKAAEDATAAAIAQLISDSDEDKIDEKFDTLKEIADWILSSEEGADSLNAAERIGALETKVGVPASGEGESAVAATGLYKAVADEAARAAGAEDDLQDAIDAINAEETGILAQAKDYADGLDEAMDARVEALETAIGEDGSVAEQIAAAIDGLDTEAKGGDGKYIKTISQNNGVIDVVLGETSEFDEAGAAEAVRGETTETVASVDAKVVAAQAAIDAFVRITDNEIDKLFEAPAEEQP